MSDPVPLNPECNITIVTAFFDIGRERWQVHSRPMESELAQFAEIARLSNPMVIYTSPELGDRLLQVRASAGHADRTSVVTIPDFFEANSAGINQFRELMQAESFQSRVVDRNRPEHWNWLYVFLENAKDAFVASAISNGLVGTELVAWVDFAYPLSVTGKLGVDCWGYPFGAECLHLFANETPDPEISIDGMVLESTSSLDDGVIVGSPAAWRAAAPVLAEAHETLLASGLPHGLGPRLIVAMQAHPDLFDVHPARVANERLAAWREVMRRFATEYSLAAPSPLKWSVPAAYSQSTIQPEQDPDPVSANHFGEVLDTPKARLTPLSSDQSSSVTIVTAVLDLGRERWQAFARSPKVDLDRFRCIARLNNPMVVFTTTDLADQVLAARRDAGLADATRIIVIDPLSTEFPALLHLLGHAMQAAPHRQVFGAFVTPEATSLEALALGYAKPLLVSRALHSGGFDTEYAAWIDADYCLADTGNDATKALGLGDLPNLCSAGTVVAGGPIGDAFLVFGNRALEPELRWEEVLTNPKEWISSSIMAGSPQAWTTLAASTLQCLEVLLEHGMAPAVETALFMNFLDDQDFFVRTRVAPDWEQAFNPPGGPEGNLGPGALRPTFPARVLYLDLMRAIHQVMRPASYVEIGVAQGNALQLATGPAVGIDPLPQIRFAQQLPPLERTQLVSETSDEFFAARNPEAEAGTFPIDLAFIDGLHLFEQVLKDFRNVERWSHTGGIILIHDVLPFNAWQAARERQAGSWTGDVWRIIPCLQTFRPDLRVEVLDAEWSGLAVVTNLDPGNTELWDREEEILQRFLHGPSISYRSQVEEYLEGVERIDPVWWFERFKDQAASGTPSA